MSWLSKYIRGLRFALLVLLVVAIIGPWGFDRINVPAQYPCQAPNIRLEGDFCGLPLSGFWIFSLIVTEIPGTIVRIFNGTAVNMDLRPLLLMMLFLFYLVVPIIITFLISWHENQHRRKAFHMASWGLAVGVGLFFAIINYSNLFWKLWGIWLFIGLAAVALILEILTLLAGKNASRDLAL
jgi:hypothetical protein